MLEIMYCVCIAIQCLNPCPGKVFGPLVPVLSQRIISKGRLSVPQMLLWKTELYVRMLENWNISSLYDILPTDSHDVAGRK